MKNQDRRGFVRKLVGLGTILGIAELLLGQDQSSRSFIPKVQAANPPLLIDTNNNASATTELTSNGSGVTFRVTVPGGGSTVAIQGLASSASGNTAGVLGESFSANGRGVVGFAGSPNLGTNYGVVGQSVSPGLESAGVLGLGNTGVRGVSGAHSSSRTGIGVEGLGNTGVFGEAWQSGGVGAIGASVQSVGVGVLGLAEGLRQQDLGLGGNGENIFLPMVGVLGAAKTGIGVLGSSTDSGIGVRAEAGPNGTQAIESAGDILPDINSGVAARGRIAIVTGRDCGNDQKRWRLVRARTIKPGDLIFENGVKATEEGDGLAFLNPQGIKIAIIDGEGNLHIKGEIIQDL